MGRPHARAVPLFVALAACAAFGVLVAHLVKIRTDIADFIPAGRSEAARLMMQEVTSGEAARLVLIGVESAAAPDLSRISNALRDGLSGSGAFDFVQNGRGGLQDILDADLFRDRYLLSPTVSAQTFETEALRRDFEHLFEELQSSASPIVTQFGFADPTGAFLAMLTSWGGASRIRTVEGVWFAPDADRALLVAKLRRSDMDAAAQDAALATIQDAFAEAGPGSATLLLSGPAVFARDSAQAIRSDVEFLSYLSTLLVAALLLWRFLSLWVLAVVAVPVALGIAVATLAVQLIFGFVHGIAFGFGMTMLGVTVDYPVLLVGHRKQGEPAPATLRRIGAAFRLAVCTVVLGLTGMALSGFPGLAQLGTFAMVGLVTAAVTTWWLLPPLIVAIDLAPVPSRNEDGLLQIERLRRWRAWMLLLPALAAVLLVVKPPGWDDDLQNLSPIRAGARELDGELRAQLGAPDVGQLIMVKGASPQEVLRRQEALGPDLAALIGTGAVKGAEYAARFLPSIQTQDLRRALLPTREDLRTRIDAAMAGTPFRDTAFEPFLDAVDASRHLAPVTPESLGASPLAARLKPLLFELNGSWFGPVIPRAVADRAAFRALSTRVPEALFLDVHSEMNALVSDYTAQAWRWLGLGALLALAALAIGLRDLGRIVRVAGAMAAASLTTFAALAGLGLKLSLINIVSIQLVIGVGLDYALFFARRQLDTEERARTLRTLATCNVMTLVTFGLLATCRTPLLRDMGLTVVLGVVSSMIFAFQFSGEKPVAA